MEGKSRYFMGTMNGETTGPGGASYVGAWSFFAPLDAGSIGHEIGHSFSLGHAPCGTLGDPLFPQADGSIGAWGYDVRTGSLVPPHHKDIMSYCGPQWISDYYFTQAFTHRLAKESDAPGDGVAQRSLLVWGGIHSGKLFLEPAFVVEAPPALPASSGPYTLSGRATDGRELYSLGFDMLRLPDGEADESGVGAFVFVLPIDAGWDALKAIVLSGPGGSQPSKVTGATPGRSSGTRARAV